MATPEQVMRERSSSVPSPLRLTPGRACSLLTLALLVLGSLALNRDGLSLMQGLTALWSSPDVTNAARLGQADSALSPPSWWPMSAGGHG